MLHPGTSCSVLFFFFATPHKTPFFWKQWAAIAKQVGPDLSHIGPVIQLLYNMILGPYSNMVLKILLPCIVVKSLVYFCSCPPCILSYLNSWKQASFYQKLSRWSCIYIRVFFFRVPTYLCCHNLIFACVPFSYTWFYIVWVSTSTLGPVWVISWIGSDIWFRYAAYDEIIW